jgi:epoxyqueuosine reductase
MEQELLSRLRERGYEGRIVSAGHLPELQEGIEGPRSDGLLDEKLYQEYLAGLEFDQPDTLPNARSLVVVAIPNPPTRITFIWQGEPVPALMPPTYLHSQEIDQEVEDLLSDVLDEAGYRVVRANVPKKLLSVRSGLGRYGRNNVSYVPNMGSFHRLVVFHSDLPCTEEEWSEPQMLERCEACKACLRGCPTEAISMERFLVQAERCLTFHNEKPGDVPFPSWIDPSAHNSLVGCLHCQKVCPENKGVVEWIEDGEEFSEDETAEILEGLPRERLSASVLEKLQRDTLMDDLEILPRNLRALLSISEASSAP